MIMMQSYLLSFHLSLDNLFDNVPLNHRTYILHLSESRTNYLGQKTKHLVISLAISPRKAFSLTISSNSEGRLLLKMGKSICSSVSFIETLTEKSKVEKRTRFEGLKV